jgi:hypothetical protein
MYTFPSFVHPIIQQDSASKMKWGAFLFLLAVQFLEAIVGKTKSTDNP